MIPATSATTMATSCNHRPTVSPTVTTSTSRVAWSAANSPKMRNVAASTAATGDQRPGSAVTTATPTRMSAPGGIPE